MGPRRASDLGEAAEVSGVAGVIEAARRALDDPSRPQAAVAVGEPASGEVLGGHAVHAHAGDLDVLPPAQLRRLAAGRAHDVGHAARNDDARPASRSGLAARAGPRGRSGRGRRARSRPSGRASRGTPGATRRGGPANESGLARFENMGSVRKRRAVHPHQERGVADPGDAGVLASAPPDRTRRAAPRPAARRSETHMRRAKKGRVTPSPARAGSLIARVWPRSSARRSCRA